MAAFVKQTIGSIGYVEYVYARKDKVAYTLVQNRNGQFPQPGPASFGAAAAGAPWGRAPGNYVLLINQPGAQTWPISGATFILVPKNPINPGRTASALKFFDWAYKAGDAKANQLDYVPMPAGVKALVRRLDIIPRPAGVLIEGFGTFDTENGWLGFEDQIEYGAVTFAEEGYIGPRAHLMEEF